jgi:hypothetical protein
MIIKVMIPMMLTRKMQHPDPDSLTQMNPDPVGSASFCWIRIHYNQCKAKLYGIGTFFRKFPYNVQNINKNYDTYDAEKKDATPGSGSSYPNKSGSTTMRFDQCCGTGTGTVGTVTF